MGSRVSAETSSRRSHREAFCHSHRGLGSVPLPPPLPLPFTAPGPPCLGLIAVPLQPACPFFAFLPVPSPTLTPGSRVLQHPRSRTYNLLSVSAMNAECPGLWGKCLLSIYSAVYTSYVYGSYSRGDNCFPLFPTPIGGFCPEFGNGTSPTCYLGTD